MDLNEIIINKKHFNVNESIQWCKKNDIEFVEYDVIRYKNYYGRNIINGFKFKFKSEIDAVAFKLQWG